MKRVRSGITMGVVFAAVVAGAMSGEASQLNLLPILQISGQHSDNVFFQQGDNKRSDTFFLVNPGIGLDYASKSFVASLAYQAGLQRYVNFSERDNSVQRGDVSLGFKLSKDLSLDMTDNVYVTTDPLAFDASGDRIQRDSFWYNRFVPGLSYHTGRNLRLAVRYDRIDINYDTLTDSFQNGFGATASTKLGDKSTVGFDYFTFKREFAEQRPELNVVDYKGQRFGVNFDRRLTPKLSTKLLAGYEDRKFDDNPDVRNFDSFIFDAALTGEFPDVFSWSIGGSQRLNDLAIRGAYKVQRATVDIRRSFQEKLRLDLSGFYQVSKNDQIPEKANFFGTSVEGQYMVAKFLNVWLGYEYLDRKSDDNSLLPFTENVVRFGLSLSYGL